MFKRLEEQQAEERHQAIAEEWVRGLDAFKGRSYEDYAHLIKPLVQYVISVGYKQANPEALNGLVSGLLSTKPENIPTETEPSITAEFLAEQIKPWVKEIREKLFHSKSAPFACIEDAKKWLAEVDKRHGEWEKKRDEWNRKVDEWHKNVDKYEKRIDDWNTHRQFILEKYPHVKLGLEKWMEMKKQGIEVQVPPEAEWQKLDELQLAVESAKVEDVGDPPERNEEIKIHDALTDSMFEIDKVIDFTWKSLEMYILTDTPPVLPSFTFGIVKRTHTLPSGTSVQNRFAKVTIQAELTFEDLRSLYRSVRQELGIEYSRPLNETNLQLYKLVGPRSLVPKGKGAGPFWKSQMEKWNALHPEDKYTTTNGIKFPYMRIAARVEGSTKEEAQDERINTTKRQK